MKLSILICTIEGREDKFKVLIESLKKQGVFYKVRDSAGERDRYIDFEIGVEIIYFSDNKQISVGAKRQFLLEMADSRYVVFIDDDDAISDDYIDSILKAIEQKPDCIGFKIECNMEGKKEIAKASNEFADWCDNIDGFRYCRTIYHKTPVKTEIALQIGFKDMRFGEDYDYSKRLKQSGLLKKEVFIDKYLYFYNYKYENPNTKYGIKR